MNIMNRPALAIILSFFLLSCRPQLKKPLTPAQIQAKTDSIVATRVDDIKKQSAEDLDRRISIEVKIKVDSLIAVCMQGQQPQVVQPENPTPIPTSEP